MQVIDTKALEEKILSHHGRGYISYTVDPPADTLFSVCLSPCNSIDLLLLN